MGKQNMAMYRYLEDEARFADLFNATQFAGLEVVNAEHLQEASEHYVKKKAQTEGDEQANVQGVELQETFRDFKKRLTNGTFLRILAIENQNKVDYTMPWRLLDYDNSEYSRQIEKIQRKNEAEAKHSKEKKLEEAEWLCKFRKSDRLAPVYTICLYHGKEKWDGPRHLSDMMDFGEDGEPWKQIFADYPMRLVCVNELTDFSCFKTSLGKLLKVLALRNNKKAVRKLIQENPEYRVVDADTAEAIRIMTNSEDLLTNMDDYKNEEGDYEMSSVFAEIMEDEREEGRKEGMRAAFTTLVRDGYLSVMEAAKRAGMSEAEFKKLLG